MYGVGNNIIIYKVTICIPAVCVFMQKVICRGRYKPTEKYDNIILLRFK